MTATPQLMFNRAHKQKRRHFHAKTTSAKLYIYNGVGARDLYIDEAHTALDIFRFAAFFNPDLILFVKILVKEDKSLTSGTIVVGDLCQIITSISLIIKMNEKD